MTPARIYALARGAGLGKRAAVTATAIALAESGGNPAAVGDVSLQDGTWGPSIGLWQVRSVKADTGTGRPRDASRLPDPTFNARSMYSISSGGAHWSPWTTYTNGAYRGHLAAAQEAAAGDGTADAPKPARGAVEPASWYDPLGDALGPDPLGVGGELLDLGGDAAGKAAGALLPDVEAFRPVVLTAVVVLGGLALVVAGAAATLRPVQHKIMGGQ